MSYHGCITCVCNYIVVQVNHVHKGYSREPENVPFMSSCPLYTC